MLQALCGIAAACIVTGHSAEIAAATTVIQSPPRLVEVEQQVVTRPRHRAAGRNPHVRLYQRQDHGCDVYNCVGPRTTFRLPNELPYSDYEQQYFRRQSGR